MSKIKYSQKNIITEFLNLKLVVLLSNVIFQGIRYMSFGEKIYKITITLIFALIINLLINNILISLAIGHSLNYLVNGQFYVVYRYLSSKKIMSMNDLKGFIHLIEKHIVLFKPLDVLVIGSFCKGQMRKSSDLDIRLFHKGDFISSLKAYFMASSLRMMGLWMKFPIDIFCFSDLKFLEKISKDEIPVNFLTNKDFKTIYPKSNSYKAQLKQLIIMK